MSIKVKEGTWKIYIDGQHNGLCMAVSKAKAQEFDYTFYQSTNTKVVEGTDDQISLRGPDNQDFEGTVTGAGKMGGKVKLVGLAAEACPTWEAEYVPPTP